LSCNNFATKFLLSLLYAEYISYKIFRKKNPILLLCGKKIKRMKKEINDEKNANS